MRAVNIAAFLVIASFTVMLLIIAKDVMLPLVIAVCIWYIITTIADYLAMIKIGKRSLPPKIAMTISSVIIIGALAIAVEIIVQSIEELVASSQTYQANFNKLVKEGLHVVGLTEMPTFTQILHEIDLRPLISELGTDISAFAGSLALVMIYVIFMLMEQGSFRVKLKSMFPEEERFQSISKALQRVNSSVKTYLTIKTLVSVTTSLISYGIMWAVGLDFAIFWAFLIFLLNFIPTVGSLVATVFPALFTLLQFEGWGPFLIVFFGVGFVQFLVGNIIEPQFMGSSLNISSLVVILALTVWGTIWGIMGMVLAVPFTVTLMVILVQFKQTRPIAILLSDDGKFE